MPGGTAGDVRGRKMAKEKAVKPAKVKKVIDRDSPLQIQNEMAQVDMKNRDFYDSLSPEHKKKFSNYLMLKWTPSVYGSAEMQAYYLMSVNENLNVHFFEINKHPKLQWLCCTVVSPGMGKQRHYWLASKKKSAGGPPTALRKELLTRFPAMKVADIDNILKFTPKEKMEEWLKNLGIQDKELRGLLG